jgi:hypothetical protein
MPPNRLGPLYARRETAGYHDEIYLGGFDDSCHATWARKSSFIVPGGLPITPASPGTRSPSCTPWCPTGRPPDLVTDRQLCRTDARMWVAAEVESGTSSGLARD